MIYATGYIVPQPIVNMLSPTGPQYIYSIARSKAISSNKTIFSNFFQNQTIYNSLKVIYSTFFVSLAISCAILFASASSSFSSFFKSPYSSSYTVKMTANTMLKRMK